MQAEAPTSALTVRNTQLHAHVYLRGDVVANEAGLVEAYIGVAGAMGKEAQHATERLTGGEGPRLLSLARR